MSESFPFKTRYNVYRLMGYNRIAALFLAYTSTSEQHEIACRNAIREVLGEE